MRFRLLVIMGVLIFVSRTIFAGSIGIEVDDDVVPYLAITESLMFGLTDDSNGVQAMFAASLFQSVFGTPFAIAPPVVELVINAMVIIVDEEEDLMVAGDVDDVLQQLRPILYSELGFIRLVCDDLTVEQRAKIREAAEVSLKLSASKLAAPQEPDHDEVVGVLLDSRPDPLSEIRQEIDKAMKEVLTAEKYAQYADLAAHRNAHRKKAAILAIAAQLDEHLCLTVDQRQRIMDEISSHWHDEWEQWLEWDSDFSEIPRNLGPIISPLFDESQASVWKQMPKCQIEAVLIVRQDAESQFNDGWWGEVVPMSPDEDVEKEDFPF